MRIAGNRGRVRTVPVHRETKERVLDYLKEAGHGEDETAPLFRPVANNRGGGRLDRALDPASIYRNVVRHYAARSGLVNEQLERSPRYIELARAKRWNGVLPATMVGTNVTPLLSLK